MPSFKMFRTAYDNEWRAAGVAQRDYEGFYARAVAVAGQRVAAEGLEYANDLATNPLTLLAERALFQNGRPYYKVFPEFVRPLAATHLRVPACYFKTPYTAWEIRLPDEDYEAAIMLDGHRVQSLFIYSDAAWTAHSLPPVYSRVTTPQMLRSVLLGTANAMGIPQEHFGGYMRVLIQTVRPSDGATVYGAECLGLDTRLSIEESLDQGVLAAQQAGELAAHDDRLKAEYARLWSFIFTLSCLITGHDRLIEPDVLSADLQKFITTTSSQEIERLHDRAAARRGDGRGYTVGRRERLMAVAKQRNDEYIAGGGAELQFQHQRCGHMHGFRAKAGYVMKWIPQLTVRPDLPVSPSLRSGVQVR